MPASVTERPAPFPLEGGEQRERLFRLNIFCDFDGTISQRDIGYEFFGHFGKREPSDRLLLESNLPIHEFWLKLAGSITRPLTPELIDEYLLTVPLDTGYGELYEWAAANEIPFAIVSDGFDFYIKRFLALHGAPVPRFFSNHGELDEAGRLVMSFPNRAERCECFCATCKRNMVLTSAEPNARIVYIGDGISDYCPAQHADIIFAKGKLAAYCNAHRLPHYPFKTLGEVTTQLGKLWARRRLGARHQAAMLRKRAWEEES